MKIAFATKDAIHINEHFGWAKHIDVYEINQDGYRFLERLEFHIDLERDEHDDKLLPKLKALADCTIVYVSAIGAGAAARIINSGITPIKANSEDDKIEDILSQLLKTLNGNPPPWLRKALKQELAPVNIVEVDEEEEVVV